MTLNTVTLVTWCVVITLMVVCRVQSQDYFFCRDLASANCANIKPHHCYLPDIGPACCSTCRRWRRPSRLGCEYGDRLVIWRSEFGKYTCRSYISFFSSYNCLHNSEFRRDCCQSCAEALNNKK